MAAVGADFNRAGELAQNGFKKRNLQEFLFLDRRQNSLACSEGWFYFE
jgi:hypothetical protein